jgi:hypothetical protein
MSILCEWFALCDHEAIGTTKHPVLGDVLICERCSDRFALAVEALDEYECPNDHGKVTLVDVQTARGFTGATIYISTLSCGCQDVDDSGDNIEAVR